MNENPKHIHIRDFQYDLPDERIAKFPLPQRDHSKLLLYRQGEVSEDHFYNLPRHIPAGSLMIFNNTKVIQARLHFRKETGALIEVFCLEPIEPNDYALNFQQTHHSAWLCMIGNLKKWKEGPLHREMTVKGLPVTLTATRGECRGTSHWVDFTWDNAEVTFADILEVFGELPIPPYLNRETQESDLVTYQTVYSKIKGSVAAPTAGLHFTPRVLDDLKQQGVDLEELTLHVGAGTFKPVKSEEIEGHEMHTEYISVSRDTIAKLLAHNARAIAVGTTSVRTLESLYHIGLTVMEHPDASEEELHVRQWQPYELSAEKTSIPATEALQALLDYLNRHQLEALHTSTQIIIAPGYDYKIVKAMVTNFHQPQSTLLLLVSAFVHGDWRKIYDYALAHDFRFLSYGDSSLLIP
ncbi:MAG: S-adenosylmethionine:tRNA ribosyltransferase-isomerase [Candidatus Bacteroides intestinipullorum]|uniref:S-adenosylmethionine:tRNA ribosyltransferase-isomerase n=1 Tax=Candidatus Bacteroides intestinipullorum TaxID=2838471 RepID=A0A9E2KG28_9BACE|nr:S-adenosylmethionine:tRNA ribosyltransferase-isomerase [Candidatus Bacteroides intestinipullorum]